jgi:hypothetical protein
MLNKICGNNNLIYNKLGYNNTYSTLQAASRSGAQASRIYNYNNRYGIQQNLIPIPCPIHPVDPVIPSYPANVNCKACHSYFYNSNTADKSNIWPNFGGNLSNTRAIPANSIYTVKSENCLSMSCQQQVKLPMTLNGVQISGYSLTYHGICDAMYYYNVIVLDAATYLGANNIGVLLGLDLQSYGNVAFIIKVNRKTGIVEACKSCAEITGKPNKPVILNIFDTGDASTRGPLFLYKNYLYLTGQDTQYSSTYKINTSDLSLVHYEQIPPQFSKIITQISGIPITVPFKTREMREVLVIPPTTDLNPDIDDDFRKYPLVLTMSTGNTTYAYVTNNDSDAERLIRFKNYYNTSGMVFAYLDKGSTWENIWNFSTGPEPLVVGDILPDQWFSPQTVSSSPTDTAYIWIPLYNGFIFTDKNNNYYASTGKNFVIGSYNFNTSLIESFNTTQESIDYFNINAKPGYITFENGNVFDINETYTILLADNSGTYDVSGNQLLAQPIKLYLYPNFVIPEMLSTCPGDIIANAASHYGAGIWGSPCWDSSLNFLYIPGGNAYNFPQYERDLRDPSGVYISKNIQALAQANAVFSDGLIGKPLVPVVEFVNPASPYLTYMQYLDIQDASSNAQIFFNAQKTFLQNDRNLQNIQISERGNRLLDCGISAINPYKKGGKAELKWYYRLIWGGIFTFEGYLNYPSGLIQTPGFFQNGGLELNNDTLGVSLTTIGTDPSGNPIRRLVANNKGEITVLNPDAYFNIVPSVSNDIDCSQGISSCSPPLLNGSYNTFLSCFPDQLQGPIGGLITMTTTTGRNLIITRDSGNPNTVNTQNGLICTAQRVILPKAKGMDRFAECNSGFLTCYDLDMIGTTTDFNKIMLWQIPLIRFGTNNGQNVPAIGYPSNISNGPICAYGDIITVGMSNGQLWLVDAKDGIIQHKIAVCEGIACGGPIVSNQLMLTGGYNKWGKFNANKGYFYYSFTPNGK